MTHTWGHLGRDLLSGVIAQATGLNAPSQVYATQSPLLDYTTPTVTPGTPYQAAADCGLDGQPWSGSAPPKGYKVVNYCGQAVLRKIRRRRRRRMFTASDAADLSAIVGIVGKGQLASSMINRR